AQPSYLHSFPTRRSSDLSQTVFGQDVGLVSLYDQVLDLLARQPAIAKVVAESASRIHLEGAHCGAKPDILPICLHRGDLCPWQLLVHFALLLSLQIVGEITVASTYYQLVLDGMYSQRGHFVARHGLDQCLSRWRERINIA